MLSKEQLLRDFVDAYEAVISAATDAAQRGMTRQRDAWGPREIVAHLAGWEVMATVRIPHIVAGMPPIEFADPAQATVMNDAINATIVTMIGEQSLDAISGILRQAYQTNVATLRNLDDSVFQPGQYVYERTRSVIEHCKEHMEALVPAGAGEA